MKRGEQARGSVVNTIMDVFQNKGDLECFQDKKIYVWANDGPGGERIQFAISITMPKTPISAGNKPSGSDCAWSNEDSTSKPAVPPMATQLSNEDRAKVEQLMQKLGIKD